MVVTMDVVEKKINSDCTFDDMTDEMKTMSMRLYLRSKARVLKP